MSYLRPPSKNRPGRGWEARYRDPYGRSRSKTFATKAEAKRYLAQVNSDVYRGEWCDPSLQRVRFEEWATEWRATAVRYEPATLAFYDSLLRVHVLPALGRIPVAAVDQLAVRRFVAEMVAAGVGPRSIQGAFHTVSHVMATAQGAGAVRANPCVGVKVPRLPKHDAIFLTPTEINRLADAIQPVVYRPLLLLAAYSGLRAGELGGLRLRRLDLRAGKIEVVGALKDVNGRMTFGPTKNHKRRVVRIPRFLCEELTRYLLGRDTSPDALVFTSPQGAPLQHRVFYRRNYKPAVHSAGLPSALRFHDLRHTCAALLIAQGAHPRAIMEHLGHSSITVTLDTYGHLMPSLADDLAAGLEQSFRAATNKHLSLVTPNLGS